MYYGGMTVTLGRVCGTPHTERGTVKGSLASVGTDRMAEHIKTPGHLGKDSDELRHCPLAE